MVEASESSEAGDVLDNERDAFGVEEAGVFGIDVAENEELFVRNLEDLIGFVVAVDGEHFAIGIVENLGDLGDAVAVGIGLENWDELVAGELMEEVDIGEEGSSTEVDVVKSFEFRSRYTHRDNYIVKMLAWKTNMV